MAGQNRANLIEEIMVEYGAKKEKATSLATARSNEQLEIKARYSERTKNLSRITKDCWLKSYVIEKEASDEKYTINAGDKANYSKTLSYGK